jgi:F-type H+-transporting ATPase subunit gamma
MASVKELRLKLRSLQNTNKITTAMKLVATSKLSKAQDAQRRNKPYSNKIHEVLARALTFSSVEDPLTELRSVKKIRVYVYSSDKGLCGSFNNSLIKEAEKQIEALQTKAPVEIFCFGKKCFDALNRKYQNVKHLKGVTNNPNFEKILPHSLQAIEDFQTEKVDETYLIFNQFENVLTQIPTCQKVMPVSLEKKETEISEPQGDYLFEPNPEQLLKSLLPKMVSVRFFQALLENAAGEHGARMTAMDNATTNSRDLIGKYTLQMNRVRQAAITTELTEITAGAESLKG